jgi:hypothetical protein
MAAGRVHDLAGNQPLEGQVGQNVRNFYPIPRPNRDHFADAKPFAGEGVRLVLS